MNKFHTLIYTANLHVGGGVQVAVSVINEISKDTDSASKFSVLASSEVKKNLDQIGCQTKHFRHFSVEDHFGFSLFRKRVESIFIGIDSIFVVFGPLYQWFCAVPVMTGFAQPWIVYPDNELYARFSLFSTLKAKAKFFLQKLFFRRSDLLLVELEHVRAGLLKQRMFRGSKIEVVENCISDIYFDSKCWLPIDLPDGSSVFKIGFLGRNYIHKNTSILPQVKRTLRHQHGKHVSFYVTFTKEEWELVSDEFRREVTNVGALTVAQCPSFYEFIDAVVFPSLLECFSATPLESMVMKKPLFASDRPFNRDVCGNFAYYFDPLSSDSVADAISRAIDDPVGTRFKADSAYRAVMGMSDARARVKKYLMYLNEI